MSTNKVSNKRKAEDDKENKKNPKTGTSPASSDVPVAVQKPKTPNKKAAFKKAGLGDLDFTNSDVILLRKAMKSRVDKFHRMVSLQNLTYTSILSNQQQQKVMSAFQVDKDWHDGYEEQTEFLVEHISFLKPFLQAVYNIAIEKGVEFERCFDILVAICDW
jgi:hypothetical protein